MCLSVATELRWGYWALLCSFVLFAVCCFDGSPTHKYLHNLIHPYDDTPPPNCGHDCVPASPRDDDAESSHEAVPCTLATRTRDPLDC